VVFLVASQSRPTRLGFRGIGGISAFLSSKFSPDSVLPSFPSWQSKSSAGRGAQSEAAFKAEGSLWETALKACAPCPETQHPRPTECGQTPLPLGLWTTGVSWLSGVKAVRWGSKLPPSVFKQGLRSPTVNTNFD
jgi:hypothetical protein